MRQRANGDEIHACFGVGAHIFQGDSAGAFQRNPARLARADFNPLAHILHTEMIEQDRFRAMVERLLQFFERSYFNLDWLASAPIANRALPRRVPSAPRPDLIALEQSASR